ncbi:septal ring lytic transglycosylase RlpA family protein [Erythrobacter sp. HA6-11]
MKRGLLRRAKIALGFAIATLGLASMLAAQDTTDRAIETEAEEVEFEDAFEPYDSEPPLYEAGEEEEAVDLTEIEIPRGPRTIRDLGTGTASFYGKRFHGRTTANGERFDMRAMTAAHRSLPFGSKVRVTNPSNGRQVVVRINDRGPFAKGRAIDLSRAAAEEIGMIRRGHARVEMELVE